MSEWIGRPLDLLLGYDPSMPMPTVRDKDDRPWHPTDAQPHNRCPAVRARMSSETDYTFWRRKHTTGLRWMHLSQRCWRTAMDDARMLKARQLVRKLIEAGRLVMPENIIDIDAERAEEALAFTVAVIKNANESTKDRLAAAKTLLDFTKQKPSQKVDATIKGAEAFLDSLDA